MPPHNSPQKQPADPRDNARKNNPTTNRLQSPHQALYPTPFPADYLAKDCATPHTPFPQFGCGKQQAGKSPENLPFPLKLGTQKGETCPLPMLRQHEPSLNNKLVQLLNRMSSNFPSPTRKPRHLILMEPYKMANWKNETGRLGCIIPLAPIILSSYLQA